MASLGTDDRCDWSLGRMVGRGEEEAVRLESGKVDRDQANKSLNSH